MNLSVSGNQRKPAVTADEFRTLLASNEAWFVRSVEDFEELAASRHSPLIDVPDDAIEEFKQTLIFKNGGLAHANYESLVDYMTVRQFVELWENFGLSSELFEKDNHKTCVSTHVCDNKQWSYCGPDC
jgi:hypothetical protein